MLDRFTDMLRRSLAIDWAQNTGTLDLRYHSLGIGGVHSMPAPPKIVEATAALKPKLIRIFLQEFLDVYPAHGIFDWTKMDAYMDAVHAMGGDVMASICIKPPLLYPNIDENIFMPNDVSEWQALIRAMVLRYSKEKPYVTHWAIANEMNIGEYGGCPYLIKNPDDFFSYYKITAAPIREAVPGIQVGGPSYAGADGAAEYLGRFAALCKANDVALDFTCYNAYSDSPEKHAAIGRAIRDALNKHNPEVKLYMTEFNVGIGEELSLEEKAYAPKRAASLAASILSLHEDGCLDGTFQYHLYDQWNDPREFSSWYAKTRYMAEHWNDIPHRLGLFDLDGKPRPSYILYQMLYALTGQRVCLQGGDTVLRGLATRNDEDTLSMLLINFAEQGTPDSISQIRFAHAPAGVYRMHVQRIDEESCARMKETPLYTLPPTESRIVYVHPDFHFDVFTPADSVTLVRFAKED